MTEIARYLSTKKDTPEAPDSFIHWRDITVSGNTLIAQDAVIRHDAEESLEDWPHVIVAPGEYQLEVKLFRDDADFNRVKILRAFAKGATPQRGNQIGEIEVDYSVVGICDYDPYMQAVRDHLEEYEEYADDLYDLMENVYSVADFMGQKLYYTLSGYGDGVYPVYELLSEGNVVGLECDFSNEDQ